MQIRPEYRIHCRLKSCRRVRQSERQDTPVKQSVGCTKGSLRYILVGYPDLMVS